MIVRVVNINNYLYYKKK